MYHKSDLNETDRNSGDMRVDNVSGGSELAWTKYARNMIIGYDATFCKT